MSLERFLVQFNNLVPVFIPIVFMDIRQTAGIVF